jgi:hypothetical protein
MTTNKSATTFGRKLGNEMSVDKLPVWWGDLLMKWCPAGQLSKSDGLRLAIRNGYVNFYRNGQSVARVSVGMNSVANLEVHLKYVTPEWKNLKIGKDPKKQYYVKLKDDNMLICDAFAGDLGKYDGATTLDRWIAEVANYKGAEKTFVDKLVSCNQNIIDLEMGLPNFLPEDSATTVSPRMDLVAIEEMNGQDTVVFWEAKMMGNGELRAKDDSDPKLFKQLQNYTTWLSDDKQKAQVAEAYKANCGILVAIHSEAKKLNPAIAELGSLVRRVADKLPNVDTKPRVVISDYDKNVSWVKNGHAKRLSDRGYHVQLVQCDDELLLKGI